MTKSSVIPFSFENYSVRIIVIDEQPWFVANVILIKIN